MLSYFRQWKVYQALLSVFGVFSICTGSVFAYRTQFQHPHYRYLPADESWQDSIIATSDILASPTVGSVSASLIWVEVAGAVVHPGVYSLNTGSRLQDALLKAGGFGPDVDTGYIHQQLNLASRLQDQQKIYIPFLGQGTPTTVKSVSLSETSDAVTGTELKPLSSASAAELETVSGIGAKRSGSILTNGPYSSWDDLRQKAELTQPIIVELQKRYSL